MDTTIAKQFHFLIELNTGTKLENVIEQILGSNILNINQLFIHHNIQALNEPLNSNKHFNTLNLFNSGNYITYKSNQSNFIELTEKMLTKLKILTIIDLAKENKTLTISNLMKLLDISDNFVLEKLIFECNSFGVITGKINQKDNLYKILTVTARDNIPDLDLVRSKIQKWYDNVEKAEDYLEIQINGVRNQARSYNKRIDEMVDIGKKIELASEERSTKSKDGITNKNA